MDITCIIYRLAGDFLLEVLPKAWLEFLTVLEVEIHTFLDHILDKIYSVKI